jgi:hypothetical protein
MIERIPITSREQWLELRSKDVTASTVGALFENSGSYVSEYGLWAEKTGRGELVKQNDAMTRGLDIEPSAAARLRREYDIIKYPVDVYYRDADIALGATPDVLVECPKRGLGVIQIKSVGWNVFQSNWIVDTGSGECLPPLWTSLQALTEAYLTSAQWSAVMPFSQDPWGAIHAPLIDVPINHDVINVIKERVKGFHLMIAEGREPLPNFNTDGDIIRHIYRNDIGTEIDLSDDNRVYDLINTRNSLANVIKTGDAALKLRSAIDAELLAKIGFSQTAKIGNKTIIAKTISKKSFTVEATSYRKITIKGMENEPDNND